MASAGLGCLLLWLHLLGGVLPFLGLFGHLAFSISGTGYLLIALIGLLTIGISWLRGLFYYVAITPNYPDLQVGPTEAGEQIGREDYNTKIDTSDFLERLLGFGRISITFKDRSRPPADAVGLADPQEGGDARAGPRRPSPSIVRRNPRSGAAAAAPGLRPQAAAKTSPSRDSRISLWNDAPFFRSSAGTAPHCGPLLSYLQCRRARRPGHPERRLLASRNQNRSTVVSQHGMVCTAAAGEHGGHRHSQGRRQRDRAAIAANAMLSLVEPMSCGPGGDLFAIIWSEKDQKLFGLNASGRSPYDWNLQQARDKVPRSRSRLAR